VRSSASTCGRSEACEPNGQRDDLADAIDEPPMLSQDELTLWSDRLRLPTEARTIINHIRSSDPARRVGGGHRNVTGRYPSKKMGVTIQFESHRVELAAIYEMEHSSDVLEYYDQPQSIKLLYAGASGRRMGVSNLRTRLGLETRTSEEMSARLSPLPTTGADSPKRKLSPGKRRPIRDRVGIATSPYQHSHRAAGCTVWSRSASVRHWSKG
jgi:hypothetical protein